jgi:hypothetical protein
VIQGQAYSFTFHASGGTAPYKWSSQGSTPPGLSLSSDGTLSGTATSSGDYFFQVTVQDSSATPLTAQGSEQIQVIGVLSLNGISLPEANRNIGYQDTFAPHGGVGPFSFAVASGALPPGLAVASTADFFGQISGTPTQAGTFQFTLQVTDSGTGSLQQTASAQLSMTIDSRLVITTNSLPNGVENRPYSGAFTEVNGTPPLQWSVSLIPSGLMFDPVAGNFTGTPTQAFSQGLFVTLTDSSSPPQTTNAFVQCNIYGPPTFSQTDLGTQSVANEFVFFIPTTGGWPPLTFTLISESAPTGTQLQNNLLIGPATTVGHYSITLQVQDSASPPQTTQGTLTFSINPGEPSLVNTKFPAGVVGKPYSWGLAARSGQPPYSWSIYSGSLPQGLMLDSQGLIHGTPTAAGTSSFIVQLNDSFAPAGTEYDNISITVNPQALGRNDAIATATPLTNGFYNASISPYSDASTSAADGDYYKLTANPGATVSISILAARLFPNNALDSVLEIVDGNGTRFTTCNDPASAFLSPPLTPDPNPNDYNDACINDDDPSASTRDSDLIFQVPGQSGGAPVTFYVHVLDWRGDARPDMQYQIRVSGAN